MANVKRVPAAAGRGTSDVAEFGHGSLGHNLPVSPTLPYAAPVLVVLAYAGVLGSFWLSFAGDSSAALSIGVSTFYALVFFGVPYALWRTEARHGASPSRPALPEFLRGDFETIDGRISGRAALVQVLLVPVVLAFGSLAIGTIYVLTL